MALKKFNGPTGPAPTLGAVSGSAMGTTRLLNSAGPQTFARYEIGGGTVAAAPSAGSFSATFSATFPKG